MLLNIQPPWYTYVRIHRAIEYLSSEEQGVIAYTADGLPRDSLRVAVAMESRNV